MAKWLVTAFKALDTLHYGARESCSISALAAGVISADSFLTKNYRDGLHVNNVAYHGSLGPAGVVIPAMEEVKWACYGYEPKSGWKICLS